MTLNEKLMAANAFVFLAAGFETISTTLSYCFLELALNPDVQEKMRQEIMDKIRENDGRLTYDIIKNLQYTDKVISGKQSYIFLKIATLVIKIYATS